MKNGECKKKIKKNRIIVTETQMGNNRNPPKKVSVFHPKKTDRFFNPGNTNK